MRTLTFSTQAWDFAQEMLADHPYIAKRKIDLLAGLLQEVVDEFVEEERPERDEPLDPMRGVEFPFADNH